MNNAGSCQPKDTMLRVVYYILSDSAEGGATDLAETIAGKKAIQQAVNRLADTFLYSLVEKWNKTK